MIVSRKNQYKAWLNLKGYYSRLSGPCYFTYCGNSYKVNEYWHRLYEVTLTDLYRWGINDKHFRKFKRWDYDSF